MIVTLCILFCFLIGARFGFGIPALSVFAVMYYLALAIGAEVNTEGVFLIALFVLSAPAAVLIATKLVERYCLPSGMHITAVGLFLAASFSMMLSSPSSMQGFEYLLSSLSNSTPAYTFAAAALLCKNVLYCAVVISLAVIGFSMAFEIPFQLLNHIVFRSKAERLDGVRVLLLIFAVALGLELIADVCFRFLNPQVII